jgi:hypothetical protein
MRTAPAAASSATEGAPGQTITATGSGPLASSPVGVLGRLVEARAVPAIFDVDADRPGLELRLIPVRVRARTAI